MHSLQDLLKEAQQTGKDDRTFLNAFLIWFY